ncbi:MAG TPA: peptide-methionine (S)-S-oxide reductase MsrA [Sphingomicrobium sp.]
MKYVLATALLIAVPGAAQSATTETAVLAGGCFWGMEAVFEHVKGVRDVVSGYAGGSADDANYRAVSGERTGHAEAIRIIYDPSQVTFGQLLKIYVTVAHDPTQLNRQGPDVGPSYRSAIFPQDAGQRRAAQAFLQSLRSSGAYKSPVVTKIEDGRFYPAEESHQDFVRRNPWHPYVLMHDRPKLKELKARYPQYWRA